MEGQEVAPTYEKKENEHGPCLSYFSNAREEKVRKCTIVPDKGRGGKKSSPATGPPWVYGKRGKWTRGKRGRRNIPSCAHISWHLSDEGGGKGGEKKADEPADRRKVAPRGNKRRRTKDLLLQGAGREKTTGKRGT